MTYANNSWNIRIIFYLDTSDIKHSNLNLNPYLQCGKIHAKLVGFEKTKYFFCSLKPTGLGRILPYCKLALNVVPFRHHRKLDIYGDPRFNLIGV